MGRIIKLALSIASFAVAAGLQLSGVKIPWLGYGLVGAGVLLLVVPGWPYIRQLWMPALRVEVKHCEFDSLDPRSIEAALAVHVLFRPCSPPIQLASVQLFFEGRYHEPVVDLPKRIERDETYKLLFRVGDSLATRWMIQGLNQGEGSGKAISEQEWPKAHLHIVAGALDFKTKPFLAPTPRKPLASRAQGLQP